MLICRLEAEMAAIDVQRLQQQLHTARSRLAEESQQRRQLQAELEQVWALSAALGLSSCLSRRLQAQLDQASNVGCAAFKWLPGCSSRAQPAAGSAQAGTARWPVLQCKRLGVCPDVGAAAFLLVHTKQAHWPSAKDAAHQETALVK